MLSAEYFLQQTLDCSSLMCLKETLLIVQRFFQSTGNSADKFTQNRY